MSKPTIEQAVSLLYRHEINCSIASFWDAQFTVMIGDELNGFVNEDCQVKPGEIAETLIQLAKESYPLIDWEAELL